MESHNNIAIQVHQLDKNLGKKQVLSKVSAYFAPHKLHGIIGPEGAGKTTLLRSIVGLYHPNAGYIEFTQLGTPIPRTTLRDSIAYMPQQASLYPDLSIDEHLEFFKALYSVPESRYRERREELLDITRLTQFVDRPAGKLSGGMQKKVGLMCALLRDPKILILDEPTNGVDPISRREFWELLYRLLAQKILIITSTSYMDEAMRSEVVHLMDHGNLLKEGDPKSLLAEENVPDFDHLFMRLAKDDAKKH